jgi:hypothetical protein
VAEKRKIFTPWSSLDNMLGKLPSWWPAEEQQRIAAYEKYDQMYWNDPTQYAVRVLEDEQPIYVPNARVVVDTTAQYLMKGMKVKPKSGGDSPVLDDFFARERFYSKFHMNKLAGIARGDAAFHIVANPNKEDGTRISIDTLHPGMVWRVKDEEGEDPEKVIRVHIVDQWIDKEDNDKVYIRKLTYEREEPEGGGTATIYREEAIYELDPEWWGPVPKLHQQLLKREALDAKITQIPVYWFPNLEWESQDSGSSELRGLEFLEWAVSQGTTDTQMSLGLEGLGVYATDGGRPVDDDGNESDWEVSPGKVMEVPAGSYFRRVEGVGSITPMMDQLKYMEGKMFSAASLTDVSLGQVDVQVAQSGIALAIKFMPTLAKIEPRDTAYKELLGQMFFDLKAWFEVYETFQFPDVEIIIDENKLPVDRVAILNELNNMIDRKIISRKTYRVEVKKLGYSIDDSAEETQILKEAEAAAKVAALAAPPGLQQNAQDAAAGKKPVPTDATGGNNQNVDKTGNQSNNQSRPNESSGTESGQTPTRQAKT